MTSAADRRYNRIAQQKFRNGKTSHVTEMENMKVLLAWKAGELSEGQVAKIFGISRIEAREYMDSMVAEAAEIGEALFAAGKRVLGPIRSNAKPITPPQSGG